MSNYQDPNEWGPPYWFMIKSIAHNYPTTPVNRHRIDVKRFFENLNNMWPSEKFTQIYNEVAANHSLDTSLCCRDCMIKWATAMNNDVVNKIRGQTTRFRSNIETGFNTSFKAESFINNQQTFSGNPKEWGPPFWYVMKCISHNYPLQPSPNSRMNVKKFYEMFGDILPCEDCMKEYKDVLIKMPLDNSLCCRDCLIKWVTAVHNEIAARVQKKTGTRSVLIEPPTPLTKPSIVTANNLHKFVPPIKSQTIPSNRVARTISIHDLPNCNCGKK
jgi:hypothetical protein